MAGLRLLIKDEAGNVRTLSDNAYVGPEQPINEDIVIWIDTTSGQPELKFKHNNEWIYAGGCPAYSEVTTLNNVEPAKFIKAELWSWNSSELRFATIPPAGTECHIIAHNTSSNEITITIPAGENYVNMTDDALTIDGDGYIEINAISDGSKLYIRSIQ